MARNNQGPRGQQAQGPNHLTEFRKDALEVMSEVLGAKFGKTLVEVLPDSIKQFLIDKLGGADGTITDRQIDVFSYIPKFLFTGTMSEEGAQSFVRHFVTELRAYGANPHPDKAQRRADLKRIFTGALSAANDNATATVKKMNFFDAMNKLPEADRKLALQLRLLLMRQNSTQLTDREHPGQKKTVTYAELEKLGNEREVTPDALSSSIDILRVGDGTAALEEWLRVLTNAPLLNPPKTHEKPSFAKQFFDDIANEARDLLKPTQPGEPLGEPFAFMQRKTQKWR